MDRTTPEPGRLETEPVACARCGESAADTPPTWTCSVENGVRRYICDTCARANIQAIESRLDSSLW
ncbi:hypothetical protein RKE29_10030 [Streptomyces sp. B1866]|uniref:hypothetical protein n=1 Tax=Streptomyces sp. B1866 TaxID=3075431 RepID=UPI00288C9FF7|nr:hypothetical protein [Streptomyces sp. B1866]MDT3396981.1 hypothetical protein [Streptomyces sp. B1866]